MGGIHKIGSRYFVIFFLSIFIFSLFLFSCSRIPQVTEDEVEQAALQVNYLTGKYGVVAERAADEFVSYIEQRLLDALLYKHRFQYQFVLLKTHEPFAFSPGGGYIIFSTGMVRAVNNEAELAFVLAHELAHQELGHTSLVQHSWDVETQSGELKARYQTGQPGSAPKEIAKQQEMELEADKFAVGLIALAGYDPRISPHALMHSYSHLRRKNLERTHPEISTRIQAIQDQIAKSGWAPPGTIDRWSFRRFKSALGQS